MVLLKLWIKAELENVTDLVPSGDDFEYFFKVKCNSCHEVHPKFVALNRREKHPVSGSKNAEASFVWRCGMCKREHSANFEDSPILSYGAENGTLAPLLSIDCRGLEFIDFDPRGTWKCRGTGTKPTEFSEVNLFDDGCNGEWFAYDENSGQAVSISDFGFEWRRA